MTKHSLRTAGCAVAVFALIAAFHAAQTNAGPGAEFNNGSLRGSYALVGNGGANEAASVGVTAFDGAGGASRVLTLNEADPDGTGRLILEIPAVGSYSVNPNGTGTAVFLNELPDGSKIPFHFDFVITRADRRGRGLLADSLHLVQREPGIAAKLVVFDLTRLPN